MFKLFCNNFQRWSKRIISWPRYEEDTVECKLDFIYLDEAFQFSDYSDLNRQKSL